MSDEVQAAQAAAARATEAGGGGPRLGWSEGSGPHSTERPIITT